MDDLQSLVSGACAGDLDAFGELVQRFQDMAYGYAFSILGDFHLAQDAAQEAFVEAYRQLPNLREPKAFPGWLRRIVFKYCDRQTRGKRVATVPLDAVAEAASDVLGPDAAVQEHDMKDAVLEAIKALPEQERAVTTLFYINGYTQKEVADFLDVPVTTVNNRLHASRKRLKMEMIRMVDQSMKSHPLPKDFAGVVVREVASDRDLVGAVKHLAHGYHGKRMPDQFRSVDSAKHANIYVVGDEGNVVSAGYFDETTLGIGGTMLHAVRPREMAGEAEGVPDPVFVKGFQGCFKMAKDKGIPIAVAHGSMYDHGFCGFVPCFYYPVVTLSCETACAIECDAELRLAKDDTERKAAEDALHADPYVPKMSAFIEGGEPHVIERNGFVEGYARVNAAFVTADHYDMPFGHVPDVTAQTRDAALAAIRRAGELATADGLDEVCFMQSHKTLVTQTALSLGGTYRLRPSCNLQGLDAEMVAIVDLSTLARELEPEFTSRLAASAVHGTDAGFSIEMDGVTVGFVADGGRIAVVSKRQQSHRALPRWLVTRLFMGYTSGAEVLAMGGIPCDRRDGKTPDSPELDMKAFELPANEAALFAALFPKLWPTSTPDPDVWPWVIGKPHPRYQGEDRKTPQMKAAIDDLRFPWIGY